MSTAAFEEAKPDHPEAEKAVAWIGALYETDRRAEGSLKRLAELRRTESVRVLDELKEWLGNHVTLASLSIGKAAAYTLGNWPKLVRFVDDAHIPLDNNATERGIRGPVVGRRSHLARSRGAAPRSRRRSTPLSRPRNSTTSFRPRTSTPPSSPPITASCCCPISSRRSSAPPLRSAARLLRESGAVTTWQREDLRCSR